MTEEEIREQNRQIAKSLLSLFGFTEKEIEQTIIALFEEGMPILIETKELQHHPKPNKLNCLYYARSPHLRCAVNPLTDTCEECKDFATREGN